MLHQVGSAYARLAKLCEDRGLWLELHVSDQVRGDEGREHRVLQTLEVWSRDGENSELRVVASVMHSLDAAAQKALSELLAT